MHDTHDGVMSVPRRVQLDGSFDHDVKEVSIVALTDQLQLRWKGLGVGDLHQAVEGWRRHLTKQRETTQARLVIVMHRARPFHTNCLIFIKPITSDCQFLQET
ncbi:hypothetical protein OSH10_08955 [Kaistia defluvii]|nr:hypothetical protein [Kaistia defluvii]